MKVLYTYTHINRIKVAGGLVTNVLDYEIIDEYGLVCHIYTCGYTHIVAMPTSQ